MKIERLEIKYLSAYLPYRLQVKYTGSDRFFLKNGDISQLLPSDIDRLCIEPEFKPILRQLSDLTKEIEVNGEKFYPAAKMITHGFHHSFWYETEKFDYRYLYAMDLEKLLEWKFDVFGLLENNLAINLNDLNL